MFHLKAKSVPLVPASNAGAARSAACGTLNLTDKVVDVAFCASIWMPAAMAAEESEQVAESIVTPLGKNGVSE